MTAKKAGTKLEQEVAQVLKELHLKAEAAESEARGYRDEARMYRRAMARLKQQLESGELQRERDEYEEVKEMFIEELDEEGLIPKSGPEREEAVERQWSTYVEEFRLEMSAEGFDSEICERRYVPPACR